MLHKTYPNLTSFAFRQRRALISVSPHFTGIAENNKPRVIGRWNQKLEVESVESSTDFNLVIFKLRKINYICACHIIMEDEQGL